MRIISARAAYQRLDADSQTRIENLVGIHDYIYSRTSVSEDAVNQGQRTFMYPVRQKLVRTNPRTGEKNFYVGSHVRDIDGWQRRRLAPLVGHFKERSYQTGINIPSSLSRSARLARLVDTAN